MRRGATSGHISLLLALRTRVDAATGTCRDGLQSLGRYSGQSDRSVSRHLGDLTIWGCVSSERRPSRGGPQGFAWISERRPLAFDRWVREERDTATGSTPELCASSEASDGLDRSKTEPPRLISQSSLPEAFPNRVLSNKRGGPSDLGSLNIRADAAEIVRQVGPPTAYKSAYLEEARRRLRAGDLPEVCLADLTRRNVTGDIPSTAPDTTRVQALA